jgi:hypothetical protein
MSQVPAPAQTPQLIVEAGGLDMVFSPECQAALLACGIQPNSFDSYKRRAAAEKRARAELQDQAGSSTSQKALDMGGPEKYVTANSQSGHMAQNALFQGQRDSPCTNVPPNNADPTKATDGGGYGYQMGTAPCTDHFGGSTEAGTTHKEITALEATRAAEMRKDDPTKRLTQAELKDCVRETAKVAAEGADPKDGTARAQRLSEAQAAVAKNGQNPAEPAKDQPDQKTIDKAADCMADAWEKAINDQREQCINQYSTEAQIDRDHPNASPEEKAKLVADRKKELDEKMKDPDFQKKVRDRDPSLKKADQSKECLEAQANWLKDYKSSHNGNLPPVAGRVPGTKDTTDGPHGDSGEVEG